MRSRCRQRRCCCHAPSVCGRPEGSTLNAPRHAARAPGASLRSIGIENPVHILFLAAVALIVLGPKRLPELAKALGQGIREFRESLNEDADSQHLAAEDAAPPQPPVPPPSDTQPAPVAQPPVETQRRADVPPAPVVPPPIDAQPQVAPPSDAPPAPDAR